MAKTLGLCLSGGGHRATAFSLGALMYVVESGRNQNVSAISSVSGGSITNAFVATLRKPFSQYTAPEFEVEVARFASQIAGSPRWWYGAVLAYLALFGVWALLTFWHFPQNLWSAAHLYFFLAVIAWAFVVGPRSRGTLWGWWGTWMYLGLLVPALAWNLGVAQDRGLLGWSIVLFAILALVVFAWGTITESAFAAGTNTRRALCLGLLVPAISCYIGVAWHLGPPGWPILSLAVLVLLVFARGQLADWALAHTINFQASDGAGRHTGGTGRPLSTLPTAVRHVFCATELHSGRHAYFSHDLIYVPFVGVGNPLGMKLSTAIQVSANFPGGFPVRLLRHKRRQEFVEGSGFVPPKLYLFALTDGGVYDNTGASWFLEAQQRPDRAEEWSKSSFRFNPPPKCWSPMAQSVQTRAAAQLEVLRSQLPDQLIVVNASQPEPWRAVGGALLPLVGEVKHLLDMMSINYAVRGKEQATEQMRRFLRPVFRRKLQATAISLASDPTHTAISLNSERGEWERDDVLSEADVEESVIARARAVIAATCKRVEDLVEIYRSPKLVARNISFRYSYVGTKLRPLGESDTANLLWQGYFQTMVNAAILLDDCPIIEPCPPKFARFQALAAGRPNAN